MVSYEGLTVLSFPRRDIRAVEAKGRGCANYRLQIQIVCGNNTHNCGTFTEILLSFIIMSKYVFAIYTVHLSFPTFMWYTLDIYQSCCYVRRWALQPANVRYACSYPGDTSLQVWRMVQCAFKGRNLINCMHAIINCIYLFVCNERACK